MSKTPRPAYRPAVRRHFLRLIQARASESSSNHPANHYSLLQIHLALFALESQDLNSHHCIPLSLSLFQVKILWSRFARLTQIPPYPDHYSYPPTTAG